MPPLELKMAGMDEGEDEPAVPLRRSHGIQYIRRFYATKNSWKGKYARIFCICEKSVLTLNPTTFDVTNEWTYAHDLVEVTCTGIDTHEFSITVRKAEGKTSMLSKSTTKISFSCEHRAALVTALQMAKVAALEAPAEGQPVKTPKSPVAKPAFAGAALTKDGNFLPLALVVCPWALELRMMAAKPPGPEAEAAAAAAAADDSAVSLASISYENFEAVRAVRQEGGGAGSSSPIAFVLHHGVGRVAILSCERRRDLLTAATKAAAVLGIGICIGSELGVPATPPGSISERARGAVEQAIAWGGTADGQPLGPHASSRVAIAMARGIEEEELLAPIFEAPVMAFSSDYDDLRTPAPRANAARTIILTDTAIVEKDPNRMLVTSCRPLAEVARWPLPLSFAPRLPAALPNSRNVSHETPPQPPSPALPVPLQHPPRPPPLHSHVPALAPTPRRARAALPQLHALLRDPSDEQAFACQYASGCVRCYVAAARDAILASILEAAHSAGYGGVHVLSNKDARFALTLRLHPLSVRSDADLEAVYLSALAGKDAATAAAWEGYAHGLLLEFNANVPYSGPGALFFKDKKNERIIAPALQRLVRLGRGWLPKGSVAAADADAKEAALSVLGAMRRLVATQPGIDAVCTTPELGPQLISYAWGCLEWPALDVSGAAIEVL